MAACRHERQKYRHHAAGRVLALIGKRKSRRWGRDQRRLLRTRDQAEGHRRRWASEVNLELRCHRLAGSRSECLRGQDRRNENRPSVACLSEAGTATTQAICCPCRYCSACKPAPCCPLPACLPSTWGGYDRGSARPSDSRNRRKACRWPPPMRHGGRLARLRRTTGKRLPRLPAAKAH